MQPTLHSNKLLGIPVETQSGQLLGKVQGFLLEPGSHTIEQYEVKKNSILPEFFGKALLISIAQVISLTEEKMIVEDLILSEKEKIETSRQAISST